MTVPAGATTTPACLWLGRTRYLDVLSRQRAIHAERVAGARVDTLLLTEHERVLTTGRNAGDRHLRVPRGSLPAHGIELIETERGGDISYHGPGQLVAYPICDLRGYAGGVRRHVWRLEETAIRLLRRYGVEGDRRPGTPGVWAGDAKIASLGVYVARSVTMHGIAINISPNLADFALIVPCGLPDVRMTSLLELTGGAPAIAEAAREYVSVFDEIFAADRCPQS